jgi:hypothetical protein
MFSTEQTDRCESAGGGRRPGGAVLPLGCGLSTVVRMGETWSLRSSRVTPVINRGSCLATVVLLAVMATGLSGCSGSSSDLVPSPITSTATVTPSASSESSPALPSPSPTLPAAAQQPTREGAEAFFRYFFTLYSYSFQLPDDKGLRLVSDPGCKFCSSAVESIESGMAKRQYTEGGALVVTTVVVAPGDPTDRLIVNAIVDQNPGRILGKNGAVLRSVPGREALRVDAAVRWSQGSWIMIEVRIVGSG